MNEVAVDREFEQQAAVESQLSRPAPVRGCTGTLGWRACTLFAPAHEASELSEDDDSVSHRHRRRRGKGGTCHPPKNRENIFRVKIM